MTGDKRTVSDRNQMLIWGAVGIVVLGVAIVSVYLGG